MGPVQTERGGMEVGRESDAGVVPMQPWPELAKVAYRQTREGVVTAIARTWKAGDTGRCRLCPECRADGGMCLILISGYVPKESAALFAVAGLPDVRRMDSLAL